MLCDAAGSGDRRSQLRQVAVWIQTSLQQPQFRQPGTEGQLQFPLVKGQVIMQLSQMNTGTDRPEQRPDLLKPGQAPLSSRGISSGPDRRDPGFPDGITMPEGRRLDRHARCGATELLS